MICPKCGLESPDDAERCLCGYDFVSEETEEDFVSSVGPSTSRVSLPQVLVAVAVVGVLLGIIVPNYLMSRQRHRPPWQNACINNLRMIDSGKEQAALAYGWADTAMALTTVVNQYIRGNTTPVCPGGGKYTYGAMNVNPTCSFRGSTTHKLPVAQ